MAKIDHRHRSLRLTDQAMKWAQARATEYRKWVLKGVQRLRYRALADPDRIIQVGPEEIRYKMRDDWILRGYFPGVILSSFGDTKLVTRDHIVRKNAKRRAIRAHFLEGVPWGETDLFVGYARRLARGEVIRGCRSIRELIDSYERRIDPLFESMQREGMKSPAAGADRIYTHIGPTGDIIFGYNGNHRWYIAEVLAIETMPLHVFSRHEQWQRLREAVRRRGAAHLEATGRGWYLSHPDLADLLRS